MCVWASSFRCRGPLVLERPGIDGEMTQTIIILLKGSAGKPFKLPGSGLYHRHLWWAAQGKQQQKKKKEKEVFPGRSPANIFPEVSGSQRKTAVWDMWQKIWPQHSFKLWILTQTKQWPFIPIFSAADLWGWTLGMSRDIYGWQKKQQQQPKKQNWCMILRLTKLHIFHYGESSDNFAALASQFVGWWNFFGHGLTITEYIIAKWVSWYAGICLVRFTNGWLEALRYSPLQPTSSGLEQK